MSGFLAVITRDEHVQRVSSLLDRDECIHIPLPENRTLIYVSTTRVMSGNQFFQGIALDADRGTMVFGGAPEEELPDPSKAVDGSYFTGVVSESNVRFGADIYGYFSMLWFTHPEITAVSDSFTSLVALRREFGLPCTPNEETIRGRMWVNAMGNQQLGLETYCEEIWYAASASELTFDHSTGEMTAKIPQLREIFGENIESHKQAVRESATRMIRTLKAYAQTGGVTTLSLSGGEDSRLCLAAALAADMGDRLFITSKDNGTVDFVIAEELSEKFGFPLNQSRSDVQGKLYTRDAFTVWAAGSLGLYDPLYANPLFRKVDHPVFAVTGLGAELAKGNYGWRNLSDIGMPEEARTQCGRALEAMGIDADDKWGSEWQYIIGRNPIHAGRAAQNAEYMLRPASQLPLIALGKSSLNEFPIPGKTDPNIILDTTIVLNSALAAHRVDNPAKRKSPEFYTQRLEALGGPIDAKEIEPYRVLGNPLPASRYSNTLMGLARRLGFEGAMTGVNLVPIAESSLRRFGSLVSDEVRDYARKISADDNRVLKASTRETTSIGKLVAISVLDDLK